MGAGSPCSLRLTTTGVPSLFWGGSWWAVDNCQIFRTKSLMTKIQPVAWAYPSRARSSMTFLAPWHHLSKDWTWLGVVLSIFAHARCRAIFWAGEILNNLRSAPRAFSIFPTKPWANSPQILTSSFTTESPWATTVAAYAWSSTMAIFEYTVIASGEWSAGPVWRVAAKFDNAFILSGGGLGASWLPFSTPWLTWKMAKRTKATTEGAIGQLPSVGLWQFNALSSGDYSLSGCGMQDAQQDPSVVPCFQSDVFTSRQIKTDDLSESHYN